MTRRLFVETIDHAGTVELLELLPPPIFDAAHRCPDRCRFVSRWRDQKGRERVDTTCPYCEPLIYPGDVVAEFAERTDLYASVRLVRDSEIQNAPRRES